APASFPIVARTGDYNQSTTGGGNDIHISEFSSSLTLDWSTFVGSTSSASEWVFSIDITKGGSYSLFMAGRGYNKIGFPLVDPGSGAYFDNSTTDQSYITKFAPEIIICDTAENNTSTTSIC